MQSTPSQQLKAKITGLWGTIVGIIIGGTSLIINGQWAFSIMLIFILFLQAVELVGAKQAYAKVIEFEKQIMEVSHGQGNPDSADREK